MDNYLRININGTEARIPLESTKDGFILKTAVTELEILDSIVSGVFKIGSVRDHSRIGGRPFAKSAFAEIADDLFFSVAEVAKYMAVSERSVYNMRYQAQSLLLFDNSFKRSIQHINNIIKRTAENADKNADKNADADKIADKNSEHSY